MADEKKGIADLTDEEIVGMSDEELQAALDADAAAANAETGEDGDGAGDPAAASDAGDDSDADGGADDGDGDGDDAADGGEEDENGGEPLTKEQLEALARERDNDDGDDQPTVPRARLNEVLEANRDLRLILRTALEKGQITGEPEPAPEPEPERPVYDFKAANREYHKLLTEGDEDAALAKLDEIEDKRAELHAFDVAAARREAETNAYSRTTADRAAQQLDAVAAEMIERYPFLNNKGEQANEAAILAVNAKAKQLAAKGKTPAEALHEAATKIGGQFEKLLGKPAKQGENEGKGKDTKPVEPGKDPRSQEALRRNLGVRQPPIAKSGVGTREQLRTLDLANMTDEQIDKLSPEELAEARGDARIG